MKTLYFATSNKWKFKLARGYFRTRGIDLKQFEIDMPESRSEEGEEIAREKADYAYGKLKRPLFVLDGSFHIRALNNFPKSYIKFTDKYIGAEGILKLMENVEDRSCTYKSAVSYCEPGKEAISFLGEEKGTIAEEIRGNNGFGHDPIFIPEGSEKTYGEMQNFENLKRFRKKAVEKLKNYLLKG